MRIEIEVHEAETEAGETVRIRIVREIREFLDGTRSAELVRDHDRGSELIATESEDVFENAAGQRFRLVRRIV